jgi:hypothetical protein
LAGWKGSRFGRGGVDRREAGLAGLAELAELAGLEGLEGRSIWMGRGVIDGGKGVFRYRSCLLG